MAEARLCLALYPVGIAAHPHEYLLSTILDTNPRKVHFIVPNPLFGIITLSPVVPWYIRITVYPLLIRIPVLVTPPMPD